MVNDMYYYESGISIKPEAADNPGIQSAGFEDNNVRRLFIRKVFLSFELREFNLYSHSGLYSIDHSTGIYSWDDRAFHSSRHNSRFVDSRKFESRPRCYDYFKCFFRFFLFSSRLSLL